MAKEAPLKSLVMAVPESRRAKMSGRPSSCHSRPKINTGPQVLAHLVESFMASSLTHLVLENLARVSMIWSNPPLYLLKPAQVGYHLLTHPAPNPLAGDQSQVGTGDAVFVTEHLRPDEHGSYILHTTSESEYGHRKTWHTFSGPWQG